MPFLAHLELQAHALPSKPYDNISQSEVFPFVYSSAFLLSILRHKPLWYGIFQMHPD